MDIQKKVELVKEVVKSVKERQVELGEFGVTNAYINLMSDYANVIDSINNGVGNQCRPEHEDAEEVLKSLRDNFGSEPFGQKASDLKSISEFEREVFWAIESLERILAED